MKSASSFGSWKAQVSKLLVALVAFAAGWYFATQEASRLALNEAYNRPVSLRKGTPSTGDDVAAAKAGLANVLGVRGVANRNRKISDLIEGLNPRAVKALFDEYATKPLTQVNEYIMACLMARWGELDPQAALAAAQTIPNPALQQAGIRSIYDAWSAKDPAAAFAGLSQLKAGTSDYSGAMADVVRNYADSDPAAAYAALRGMPAGQSYWAFALVFGPWAERDPAAASAAALALPTSNIRDTTLQKVATAWATQDPAGAMAWADALPAGNTKNSALSSVVGALSQQDPSAAAATFLNLNLPAGATRDKLLQQVASNYAGQDFNGVLTWADKNLTGNDYDRVVNTALQNASDQDPAAAAAALARLPDVNAVNPAVQSIAFNWGRQDPQAAIAWAQSLPADNVAERNFAITNVFNAWVSTDPTAVAAYIQQNLSTDPSFGKLAVQVVDSWGNSDPQAALTWAQQLPAGAAQGNAITAAITQLAKVDPQTAWQDAGQLSGGGAESAQVNVLSAWAAQQPAQAAAALQSLPSGGTANTATANVAKSWLAQDPNAASQWINTLPQGPARDSAVTQIISMVGGNDPAGAFNWAVSLGDPATRNTQVAKLAAQWSNSNPAAAAAAAQTALGNLTGLTSGQQATLQKVVDNAAAHSQ